MITKILFVDNNEAMVELVKSRLMASGYEVLTAMDGQPAHDLALKHIPDLMITDASLPGMNGFELCKALKRNENTKHMPIIVTSAKTNVADAFLFLGIKDFILKPFALDDLERKIKDILRHAQMMQTQKTKILFHCVKPTAMTAARSLIEAVPQWKSTFVHSGKELLLQAKSFIPDVVVVDLFMDDFPVEEAVTQLKLIPDLVNTVILTYYSPISEAQDSVALQAKMLEIQYLKRVTSERGAREYLGPFNPENFLGLFKEYRKDLSSQ